MRACVLCGGVGFYGCALERVGLWSGARDMAGWAKEKAGLKEGVGWFERGSGMV